MSVRVFMLVANVHPSIPPITQEAASLVLGTLPDDAQLTVAFNGGDTFALRADDKLDVGILPPTKGLADAYNLLVNAHSEPFIALVHNDCFVPEHWLETLCVAAAENGFAFPSVVTDGVEEAGRGLMPVAAGIPPSCCYVVTREAWSRLGGFDEQFEGCHFEDMDLFMRAERAGYRLRQVPEVMVFHRRGTTRVLVSNQANEAFLRNQRIYTDKWGSGGTAPIPMLLTGEANGGCGIQADSIGR